MIADGPRRIYSGYGRSLRRSALKASGEGCSGDDMSDDSGDRRDYDEQVEKARDKGRRRRRPQGHPQELRETPPSGAEPSEGEEVWLNGKDAQRAAEKRPSWWRRM